MAKEFEFTLKKMQNLHMLSRCLKVFLGTNSDGKKKSDTEDSGEDAEWLFLGGERERNHPEQFPRD